MTRPQRISIVVFVGVLVACIAGLVVFDVWQATAHADSTISWSMAVWAHEHPLVSFAWGLGTGLVVGGLAVHFFGWRMISPADHAETQRLRAENARLAAEVGTLAVEVDRLMGRVATLMAGSDGGEA